MWPLRLKPVCPPLGHCIKEKLKVGVLDLDKFLPVAGKKPMWPLPLPLSHHRKVEGWSSGLKCFLALAGKKPVWSPVTVSWKLNVGLENIWMQLNTWHNMKGILVPFSKTCAYFSGKVWVQIWDCRKVFKRDIWQIVWQALWGDKFQYTDNFSRFG